MSDLSDLFGLDNQPGEAVGSRLVDGIVVAPPPSLTALLQVTIPSFSSTEPRLVRWMPRGDDLPTAGTRCLLGISQEGSTWALAWWPTDQTS